jgi:23S rRNA (uracil-5-)-methyltransferase RumA
LAYRNRIELRFGRDRRGRWVVGYEDCGSPGRLVDIDACLLQHDGAAPALHRIRGFLLDPGSPPASAPPEEGSWRIAIRRSSLNGDLLVVLHEAEREFPRAAELARHLVELPEVRGVVGLVRRPRRRGGARVRPLAGRAWIEERVGPLRLKLDAPTFIQVSSAGAAELAGLVRDAAGPIAGRSVLDLYGGVGMYGVALAGDGAAPVTVCDADRSAIDAGRRAVRDADGKVPSFVRADVHRFLARRRAAGTRADLVVANPPRTGLGRGVAAGIAAEAPGRIVLVSCDPATLARDVRELGARGYRLQRVTPVDLFPQTAHVESVAALRAAEPVADG